MNANKMFKLPNNTGPKPNTSLKVNRPSNNVPFNTSSFVNATDAVSNAANNAAKSVVNTANQVVNKANDAINTANEAINNAANKAKDMGSSMMSFLPEPVVDSMNSSLESNTSPFISIPVIIGLGVLIILFIIVAMFRNQIALAFETAWRKIRDYFYPPAPVILPPNPSVFPENKPIDQGAVSQMIPGKKEVFNIAQDKYTYTDAEPLCKAFGAELATYDQVKEAWNKGADWCNYGWIKGQSAVFPTQQQTYDKLQAGPEEERMACGTPGVNGGYFDNPELRMGVNCYGTKPGENDISKRHTMSNSGNATEGGLAYDRKVQNYKNEASNIPINPYTAGRWSS
uniref:Link domain-containing protein n=1 Tax=viral metagenome TaxID=1070528 RepID=A0A6C0DCM8_9ZZZZ